MVEIKRDEVTGEYQYKMKRFATDSYSDWQTLSAEDARQAKRTGSMELAGELHNVLYSTQVQKPKPNNNQTSLFE